MTTALMFGARANALRRTAASLAIVVALTLSGCATVPHDGAHAQPLQDDRLYFGQNIPGGGTVATEEWDEFVRTVVTPRFPDGMTIWSANGQWRDARGQIVRENVHVIELLHARSAADEASIEAIAAEYRKRFRQESVLRVTVGSEVRFY